MSSGFHYLVNTFPGWKSAHRQTGCWRGSLAPNWTYHFGLLLTAWGVSNVVEGWLDDQIYGVHHVREIVVDRFLGISFAHRHRLVIAPDRLHAVVRRDLITR